MSLCLNFRDKVILGSVLIIILSPNTTSCGEVTDCPLWQVKYRGKCECVSDILAVLQCKKDTLVVSDIFCVTWDNERTLQGQDIVFSLPQTFPFADRGFTGFQLNPY